MTVAIVTDTGCDLPQDTFEEIKNVVTNVPLVFRFGLEEFADKSISMQDFLQRLEQTWPMTSAPSPGDYIQAFRSSLVGHDQVVCITLTSKHSACYSSALLASQYFEGEQVTVVDSTSLSIGQGLQVLVAAKMAQSGASTQEIVAKVKTLQRRSGLFIALDTAKYLVRGGRANQLSGFLAGILQIRPILTLREGQLTLLEKPRGRAGSKQNLLKLATACFPAEFIAVGHVGCEGEARELASALARQTGFSEDEILIVETGMAIATHGGPGTLGILVATKVDNAF
jgi:DegV family protein with EDD domain